MSASSGVSLLNHSQQRMETAVFMSGILVIQSLVRTHSGVYPVSISMSSQMMPTSKRLLAIVVPV
eukprot:6847350-Heterocapsa_arctica.AAC.1